MAIYPFLLSPVLANEGFPVFLSFELDRIDDIRGFSFDEDEECLLGPNGKFVNWDDSLLPFPDDLQGLQVAGSGLMEAIIQARFKESDVPVNYKWGLVQNEFGSLDEFLKSKESVYVYALADLDVEFNCSGKTLLTKESEGGVRTVVFKLADICEIQNISQEIESNLIASAIGVGVDEFGEDSAEWCDSLLSEERNYLDLSDLDDCESENLEYGSSSWEVYGDTNCGVVEVSRLITSDGDCDELLSIDSEMSSCAVVVLETQVKVSIDLSIGDDF